MKQKFKTFPAQPPIEARRAGIFVVYAGLKNLPLTANRHDSAKLICGPFLRQSTIHNRQSKILRALRDSVVKTTLIHASGLSTTGDCAPLRIDLKGILSTCSIQLTLSRSSATFDPCSSILNAVPSNFDSYCANRSSNKTRISAIRRSRLAIFISNGPRKLRMSWICLRISSKVLFCIRVFLKTIHPLPSLFYCNGQPQNYVKFLKCQTLITAGTARFASGVLSPVLSSVTLAEEEAPAKADATAVTARFIRGRLLGNEIVRMALASWSAVAVTLLLGGRGSLDNRIALAGRTSSESGVALRLPPHSRTQATFNQSLSIHDSSHLPLDNRTFHFRILGGGERKNVLQNFFRESKFGTYGLRWLWAGSHMEMSVQPFRRLQHRPP